MDFVNENDIQECIEGGDIATAHAVATVADFLKKITTNDANEVRISDVTIDTMTTHEEHPEDTIANLQLELMIIQNVRAIGDALVKAANIRETSNDRIIACLRELIDRNKK